jgi:hypothetical protein
MLYLNAVTPQDERVLFGFHAVSVLSHDSPPESFGLLFRRRIEPRISASQLSLPSIILAFNGFLLTMPIKNQFRADCPSQFQERHVPLTENSKLRLKIGDG